MSKRFTDTDKWDRPWFRGLPLQYRMLWLYVLDKCDVAGIWYVDLEVASFMIGVSLDIETAVDLFSKQIEELNGGSKWFVKDFVSYQYGTLSPASQPHRRVLEKLKAEGLSDRVPARVPDTLPRRVKDKEEEDSSLVFKSLESLKDLSLKEGSDVPAKKLTDVQKVVTVFKLCQGYEKDDKSWDRAYFSRFSKSAKDLIEFLGNWRDAADCVQDVYQKLSEKGLTVTLETVHKHAAEWKKDKAEKMGGRVGILPV